MSKKSDKRRRDPISGGADVVFNPKQRERSDNLCLNCTLRVMERLIEIARREQGIIDKNKENIDELIAEEEKIARKVGRDAARAKIAEQVRVKVSEGFARLAQIAACLTEIERLAATRKNAMLRQPVVRTQPEHRH